MVVFMTLFLFPLVVYRVFFSFPPPIRGCYLGLLEFAIRLSAEITGLAYDSPSFIDWQNRETQQDPTRPKSSLKLLRMESTNPQEILFLDPEIRGLPGIPRYCNIFPPTSFILSLPPLSLDVTP